MRPEYQAPLGACEDIWSATCKYEFAVFDPPMWKQSALTVMMMEGGVMVKIVPSNVSGG